MTKTDYDIRDFGAAGDGATLDTGAIQAALDTCARAGGGVVRAGAGTYLCGTLHLRSAVELHLSGGATIPGAPNDIGAYDPPEPNPFHRYQDFGHGHWHNSLLCAEGCTELRITGEGVIDGGASAATTPLRAEATRRWRSKFRPFPCTAALAHCTFVRHCHIIIRSASVPSSPCCPRSALRRRGDNSTPGVYRPRNPRASPFYRLVREHFDEFQKVYPERYEKRFGFRRPVIREAIDKFLECGDLRHGFARLRCPNCGESRILAFSCKQRGACPSCGQKRALILAHRLINDVLAPVPHRQYVFIPRVRHGEAARRAPSWTRGMNIAPDGTVFYRAGRAECIRFPALGQEEELAAGMRRNYEVFDPLDFLAAVVQHIPNRGEHTLRYYGFYSNKSRGMRARKGESNNAPKQDEPLTAFELKRRMTWAALSSACTKSTPWSVLNVKPR